MTQKEFLKKISSKEGITMKTMSHDYILQLSKNGRTKHIFGAYWDLNSAAADRIACDKCACYHILNNNKISAIQHELLNNPQQRQAWLLNRPGVWQQALKYFRLFGQKAVLKPVQGTMGQDIFFCETIPDLEAATHAIFTTQPNAAISPLMEIINEYRVFYVCGESMFAYGKSANQLGQHNLAKGAKAFEIHEKELINNLSQLASKAAKAIGINFATVDIALLKSGQFSIMEINSGVQAKFLTEQLPHLEDTILQIYSKAVENLFNSYR